MVSMPKLNELLCEANEVYNLEKKFDENIYHNTMLLLKLYRKVIWRIENSITELDIECRTQTNRKLAEFIDSLIEIDPRISAARLNSRLQSIEESKSIIEFIDLALERLKKYPECGSWYHDIIFRVYIDKNKVTIDELLDEYNVSRTTFYREKKKAVNMFGVILWGYIFPCFKKQYNQI